MRARHLTAVALVLLPLLGAAVGRQVRARYGRPKGRRGTAALIAVPDVIDVSLVTAAYQLLSAGIALMVVGFAIGERIQLQDYTTASWIGWSWLVLASIIAYAAFTFLIANAPISLVSTFPYVNPAVAVFLGWLLLDEPISRSVLIGLIVVVGGLVLAPPVSAGRRAPPLSDRLGTDLGGLAGGDAQQFVVAGGEDVVRVAARGPDLVVSRQCDVDDGSQWLVVPNGRDAANGKAGRLAHVIGIGLCYLVDLQDCCEQSRTDALTTRGDDEGRLAVCKKNQ